MCRSVITLDSCIFPFSHVEIYVFFYYCKIEIHSLLLPRNHGMCKRFKWIIRLIVHFQQVSNPDVLTSVFVSDGCFVRITLNQWRDSWVVFCGGSFGKLRSAVARVTPTWWRSSSGSRVSGSTSTASWRHTAPLMSPSVSSVPASQMRLNVYK